LVTLHRREPDLAPGNVLIELEVQPHDADLDYGLQLIDPAASDYVMLVEESAARRVAPEQVGVSGPWSNPKIEPFGPPKAE
jgi:hypothetical protein